MQIWASEWKLGMQDWEWNDGMGGEAVHLYNIALGGVWCRCFKEHTMHKISRWGEGLMEEQRTLDVVTPAV